jgi:hypothetical protein
MEILFIILALLLGFVLGVAALWFSLQYMQKRALRKVVDQMGTDPMAALSIMLEQLGGGKKNA